MVGYKNPKTFKNNCKTNEKRKLSTELIKTKVNQKLIKLVFKIFRFSKNKKNNIFLKKWKPKNNYETKTKTQTDLQNQQGVIFRCMASTITHAPRLGYPRIIRFTVTVLGI